MSESMNISKSHRFVITTVVALSVAASALTGATAAFADGPRSPHQPSHGQVFGIGGGVDDNRVFGIGGGVDDFKKPDHKGFTGSDEELGALVS
jgi:hypothetical protein